MPRPSGPSSIHPVYPDTDEHYVIGLCDRLIGRPALRGFTFDWLRGEPDARGTRRKLPIDGYWPEYALAVEFHESPVRDHPPLGVDLDETPITDLTRTQQRRLYEERRRSELPHYGIHLIEIDSDQLTHRGTRLARDLEADLESMRALLGEYVRR